MSKSFELRTMKIQRSFGRWVCHDPSELPLITVSTVCATVSGGPMISPLCIAGHSFRFQAGRLRALGRHGDWAKPWENQRKCTENSCMLGAATGTSASRFEFLSSQTSHSCCLEVRPCRAKQMQCNAMQISKLVGSRFRSSHPQWEASMIWQLGWSLDDQLAQTEWYELLIIQYHQAHCTDTGMIVGWSLDDHWLDSWFTVFLPEILMKFEICPHQMHE